MIIAACSLIGMAYGFSRPLKETKRIFNGTSNLATLKKIKPQSAIHDPNRVLPPNIIYNVYKDVTEYYDSTFTSINVGRFTFGDISNGSSYTYPKKIISDANFQIEHDSENKIIDTYIEYPKYFYVNKDIREQAIKDLNIPIGKYKIPHNLTDFTIKYSDKQEFYMLKINDDNNSIYIGNSKNIVSVFCYNETLQYTWVFIGVIIGTIIELTVT